MSNANPRPMTLEGIKRRAKHIKRTEGITHTRALNQSAREVDFENFKHARNVLGHQRSVNRPKYRLFLTSYWTDRDTYEKGSEILEIELVKPLPEICSKSEMKLVRGLCNLRLAAPDHLVKDGLCSSQHEARDQLCQSARALHFMEATGLHPCDARRGYEARKGLDSELPENDHGSEWYDPASNQFVLLDEPYTRAEVGADRAAWAKRNGWNLRASSWPGIYFPYLSALFVAADASAKLDFDALMAKIDNIPVPVTADHWPGTSAAGHKVFASPTATRPQDKRRARASGTVVSRPSRKTVPYGRSPVGPARKPNGTMSLAEHQQAGRMTLAVLQSQHKPWAVNEHMNRLMNTLVGWLYEDVPYQELNRLYDPVDIYYGKISEDDIFVTQANSQRGVIEVLTGLGDLLQRSYPDCAPLRKILAKIDMSLTITRMAKARPI